MGVIGFSGVFRWLKSRGANGWRNHNIAVPLVVRHVTCPYCGSILSVLVLAKVSDRIDREMARRSRSGSIVNPGFRESHLSNPIQCPNPECGRTFIVFAGISYDPVKGEVRDVDIRNARLEDPLVKQLLNWPHQGLVTGEVMEFEPLKVKIYNDWEHYMLIHGSVDDLVASGNTLPSRPQGLEVARVPVSQGDNGGAATVEPPREVGLPGDRRVRLP